MMRAAVLRNGALVVDDFAEPEPREGEVLVAVRACGICGSDLHFVQHAPQYLELLNGMRGVGTRVPVDLSRDVHMGHEFCAEVIAAGPGTDAPKPGTLVTSMPSVLRDGTRYGLAFSNYFAAGFGERMVLSNELLVPVPSGIDPAFAAQTEPLAVGLHAVWRSGIRPGDTAIVIGCGPVGLTIIAGLRHVGVECIVAADFAPGRRRTATAMGAPVVVDPSTHDVFDAWRDAAGASAGSANSRLFVFEAVGAPGMLDRVMREVPRGTHIVVAGMCMEPDTIQPVIGVHKELTVQFVVVYDRDEFTAAQRAIADGTIDVSPMVTGRIGLDGIAAAFVDLAHPNEHTKIVVEPNR